ncbi:MAG: hypothetical protein STHCBS139747_005900 [Sporothrix thermara]
MWAAATTDTSICNLSRPAAASGASSSTATFVADANDAIANLAAADSDIAANTNNDWDIVTHPAGHSSTTT